MLGDDDVEQATGCLPQPESDVPSEEDGGSSKFAALSVLLIVGLVGKHFKLLSVLSLTLISYLSGPSFWILQRWS